MVDRMELKKNLLSGRNCAQCVFGAFADRLDYAEEELYRIAAGFGGGMERGDTCGAVTGALMAIGAAFGEDKEVVREKTVQFQEAFCARFGTTLCRELLGYDFSKPDELAAAKERGVMAERCPDYVIAAAEIAERLLNE